MQLTQEQLEAEFERRKKEFAEYLKNPEYQEALMQRLQLQDAGGRSTQARSHIYHLCERADNPAEGCIFFIENFAWSFDPRPEHAPHHLPFIMFEYQRDAIKWLVEHIDNGKDGLFEKSRDMGASWLFFVWVPLWYWLFRDGVNILLGSYKEALVDDKTNDSLFGKLDYGLQSLPSWMLPKRYKPAKHRTKLKLINPGNQNQITGDTMNQSFGRGSRKTVVMFDELGFWDYAKDAWESSGDSTSCRIANSTPHGYNYYSMLRDSGMDVFTMHWKLHPLKDQRWYEFECARRTPEEVAQELDISYSKSREGRVYPEWNAENVTKGVYEYNEMAPLYISWDFGKCLTEDTEALTKQGWKHHSELNEGDSIYTMNPDTGLGEWQPISGKLVVPVDEDIQIVRGQGFKSRFTNGHTFPSYKNGLYELKEFKDIGSTEFIPSGAEAAIFPEEKYTDSFVELVAWFWTEGYNNSGAIEISQAKSENFDRIRAMLKSEFGESRNLLGYKGRGYKEREPKLRKNSNLPLIRWYLNKEASKEVLELCDDKKVLSYDFINSLTKSQLELFIEVSLLADGRANRLKQAVKERTEVFVYANLLLGKKVSYSVENMGVYGEYTAVDIFTGKPKVMPYNFTRRGKVSTERYKGNVWCPTVGNHIWLARSQGSVYFTGNTDETAIIWAQPDLNTGGLRILDTYMKSGKNIDYFIPFVTGIVPSEGYIYTEEEMKIIDDHKEWRRGTHFGDPAGRFQNQVSDETVFDVLRNHGIIINFFERWKYHSIRKSATKRMLMDGIFLNANPRNKIFDMNIINAAYPKSRSEGIEQFSTAKPKHDSTSHYRSALEYLALGLEDYKPTSSGPRDKFKARAEVVGRGQRRRAVGY